MWCGLFLFALTGACVAGAQQAAGPVPTGLTNARKVFVSNAGSDVGLFPHPFSGTQARPYDEFYAAVKALGRYELVSDPAQADLVLELRLLAPSGPADPNKVKGASDPLPGFRLVVYDGKTHFVLWALGESIEGANLQKTHDHNFDEALAVLVGDLKMVTGSTAVTAAKP
jgi:hypothetical protein